MNGRRGVMKVAFAAVLAAACSGADEDGSVASAGEGPPVGFPPNGDYKLPAHTMTDWVSYAEQLAAVTIVSDEEIPPPQSVLINREGLIGRRARIRIDETVWANRGVTPLTGEIDMIVWGWYLKGDTRRPFTLLYTPWLEKGGRYVMTLVQYDRGWGTLTSGSVFPVAGDPIATEDVRVRGYSPVAHMLAGKSHDEIRQILDSTPRDPLAEKHWALPPVERYQAVAAERSRQ